jgi:hypothetical protein
MKINELQNLLMLLLISARLLFGLGEFKQMSKCLLNHKIFYSAKNLYILLQELLTPAKVEIADLQNLCEAQTILLKALIVVQSRTQCDWMITWSQFLPFNLKPLKFWDKSSLFPEPVFPRDLFKTDKLYHLCLSQLLSKLTFDLNIFNYLVIMNFIPPNKSVENWLKTCQLHLGSHWTFCHPLLNSVQKKRFGH